MEVTLDQIKLLREKSGAGMVDCQKVLKETNGDIEAAMEILRKKGIAKAAKRTGRETKEGIIKVLASDDGKEGYILEVNAETDFVSRNEQFKDFVDKALSVLTETKAENKEILLQQKMAGSTVGEELENLSGVIGEKLGIKGCAVLKTSGTIAAYTHLGGRIGVLVSLEKEGEKNLAYEIAMQVAAANPKYIEPSEVPSSELNKEKEIYTEQLKAEGKPENIIDKIMEGKIEKYYEEVCLIKQEYIKDDKKKVADILNGIKVEKFIRYGL